VRGTFDRRQSAAGVDDSLPAVEQITALLNAPLDSWERTRGPQILRRSKHLGMLGSDDQCRLREAGLSDFGPYGSVQVHRRQTPRIRLTPLEGGVPAERAAEGADSLRVDQVDHRMSHIHQQIGGRRHVVSFQQGHFTPKGEGLFHSTSEGVPHGSLHPSQVLLAHAEPTDIRAGVDGELRSFKAPVEMKIMPRALRVVVPNPASDEVEIAIDKRLHASGWRTAHGAR